MAYSYRLPVMLGVQVSGWDLTLVGMCGPCVAGFKTFLSQYVSSGTSVAIRLGYCGMSGSSISTTCGGRLFPFRIHSWELKISSQLQTGISIFYSSISVSTPGNSTYPSYGSSSTPGIYTSPMRRPYLSVIVIILG